MRQIVNGLVYLVVGGIQWRMLPTDYPPWKSVYHYFRRWRDDGTWQRIHDPLRAAVRRKAGRHPHPTAGCLDSQRVKTTAIAGLRGDDAGKKVCGRKRHIVVDTMGLLGAVIVTATSKPMVSTTIWRLRPHTFLPASYPRTPRIAVVLTR